MKLKNMFFIITAIMMILVSLRGALAQEGIDTFNNDQPIMIYETVANETGGECDGCSIENITAFLTTESICDILNKTRNSLLASAVYTGFAATNTSVECSMDIDTSVLTGDLTCDLLRYSKKTLHDLASANITTGNFSYNVSNTTTFGMATSYQYSG
jgi:hypothetical protein